MFEDLNIALILIAGLVVMASPGPATLAIAGTSMSSGRLYGLATALGIITGSITWSIIAALGLGAVMMSNVWMFDVLRYLGAGYLLFLALKSARSALTVSKSNVLAQPETSFIKAYSKGLLLHLTNPKAILFYGSLYAIGIPAGVKIGGIALVIFALGFLATIIFAGYALLFSNPLLIKGYLKLQRWFEGVFAISFGMAAVKILTTKIG